MFVLFSPSQYFNSDLHSFCCFLSRCMHFIVHNWSNSWSRFNFCNSFCFIFVFNSMPFNFCYKLMQIIPISSFQFPFFHLDPISNFKPVSIKSQFGPNVTPMPHQSPESIHSVSIRLQYDIISILVQHTTVL